MSSLHYSELCRLCLVNERVSIPIFDGESGIQSLCLKIGTCLPIKISPEDILPKNICNECFYKVENQYQFWISTANAEKQLLQWLSNVPPISGDDKGLVALAGNQNTLKTEMEIDPSSELSKSLSQVEAVLAGDASNVPEEEDEDEEEESEEGSNSEESDDDGDNGDADDGAKDDGDTDEAYDEELEPTTFVNVSFECDEAGPSGTQQGPPTAPSTSTSAPAASGSTGEIRHLTPIRIGSEELRVDCDPLSVVLYPVSKLYPSACVICKNPFSDHVVNDKGTQKMKCCTCGKLFYNHSSALLKHLAIHVKNSKPTCPVCNKTLASQRSLRQHMVMHKTDRPFPCDVCTKTFPTENKLKLHKVYHNAFKRYLCDECEYSTHKSDAMVSHKKRIHLKAFSCTCSLCGKGYYRAADLEDHMNTHTGDKPFVCDICGKPYPYQTSMKEHRRSHDPYRPPSKPAQCDTCGKILSCKSSLTSHRKLLHSGENVHICDVCGKSVTSATSLQSHLLLHTGETPFSCDVCQKSFNKMTNLRVHKRTHTGDKPYTCDECGKQFTQRSTLVVHKRYHSGERPYECHLCDRAFVTRTLLKGHQKIHGTASADMVVSSD